MSRRPSVEELLSEAHAIGITDGYAFAEWLTQEQDYFGDVNELSLNELEQSYEAAMGWWDYHHRNVQRPT